MSEDYQTGYEAGYRDGIVIYELDHCHACKNIANLQTALEENARLRSCLSDDAENARLIMGENAKLRELVQYICDECYGDDWFNAEAAALGIEGLY